jgi:23S rRNA (cytosine1962-C5)-methyltransferase
MELAQKTGFYFDQRELRGRVERLGAGRRVLDAFSFVGPLGLAAARGGATGVLAVDESRAALDVARETFARHGFGSVFDARPGEARAVLRELSADARFDLVVLDPPKLAPRRKTREGALDVYAQLAQLGARLVRDGGYLVLCSCSGAVDLNALTRQLADGVARAHADATVVERVLQGADHPVHAAFPEGLYLKALIARIGRRPGTVATQGRDP